MEAENRRVLGLRHRLWERIRSLPGIRLNGHPDRRLSGNLNVSFADVEGESLMIALKDLAVSSGSACSSASFEPSHVLLALGLDVEMAHSAIRFSLGRFTDQEQIEFAGAQIVQAVERLQGLSVSRGGR